MNSSRYLRLSVVVVALTALSASPARAFDAGPHTDMTRDALTAEGFKPTAADVGVVNNWFVDYYWNADDNPFSGHAGFWTTLFALIDIPAIEFWSQDVIHGTNHMHFDSSQEGFPNLSNTQGVDAEWQRLMKVTRAQLEKAKAAQDPLTVDTAIGMSLHTVQDFYAHTNWVEETGGFSSPNGPGLSPEFGSHPTYFDVPKPERDKKTIFSAVTGIDRGHGSWNSESLSDGANKDWPGRPLYDKTYITAYFASRQWIRAARGWLGDEALWARAQRLGSPRALRSDLRASHDVSQYSGHWQGSGEPCRKVVAACGDRYGWAGSVFSLRAAIKTYHENYTEALRASEARLRFEDLAPAFDDQPGGAPVPEPASTRVMQAQTRFVKLEVTRMRGYDWALGDPGPDDADLYANARVRGQPFASTVIHDHDQFGFSGVYAPFTWIRSVPVGWRASTPIRSITVRVRTGDRRYAGTDDDVYLRLANGLRFRLEKRAYNDFERDDDDTYAVPLDSLTRDGLSLEDLAYARIEKDPDGAGGGWFLRSFEVRVNGGVIASPTVNRWLEDNHRTFQAGIARDHRTKDVVPVWLDLDEDDYLYGADDNGDINGNDRNTDIALGYVPGGEKNYVFTGGDRFSGRLSMQNGERGQVHIRLSTILVAPPPLPVPEPTPTPTPTPTRTPTPTPTPTPTADADADRDADANTDRQARPGGH